MKDSTDDQLFAKAIKLITDNLDNRDFIKDQQLAAVMLCSNRTVYSQFNKRVGMPPKAYTRHLQMLRVKQLLINSPELSLYEVSARCGLTYDAMAKQFKRSLGITPAQARQR